MTWKKFFRPVNSVLPAAPKNSGQSTGVSATSKFNSWLPEVYAGPPDRIQRYAVYDQMNYDHEISAALDTIADFGAEADAVTKLPLIIQYNETPTPTETQILDKSLGQWVRLNKLTRRVWQIFRSTLVYGDQFFIRDPETFKLYWVDPSKIEKVIVNESDGKKIESYFIKDIDLNVKNLVATNQLNRMSVQALGANGIIAAPPMQSGINYAAGASASGRSSYKDGGTTAVDAEHIVQLSLSEGMDAAWPFGTSILEQIYKVYKQKELLEDAILIYRIHRAPERRVFFIDVGTMPPNKAQQYLERVRYEVQQKRVPSRTGGGNQMVDSTYNPMSILEDYFFAVTSEGRGSKVDVLPGGENLGCFSLDTKVDLLDGRSLSISEISEELQAGKELWTYSCHPVTGELAPGLISWAGKTKSDAKVMKITLDNGNTITCTPDHKFPIIGRGFVEASELTIGQSLTPLYKKTEFISEHKKRGYEQVYCPSSKTWKYTHRMVTDFLSSVGYRNEWVFDSKFKDAKKDVRHHVNFNRFDNSPTNLVWMNWHDHSMYHTTNGFSAQAQKLGTQAAKEKMAWYKTNDYSKYKVIIDSAVAGRKLWRDSQDSSIIEVISDKISKSLKSHITSLTPEMRNIRKAVSINNLNGAGDRFQWLLKNDADFSKNFSDLVSSGISLSKQINPLQWAERSKKISTENLKRWKLDGYYNKVFENQKQKFDSILFERFTELYVQSPVALMKDFSLVLERDTVFMEHYMHLNRTVHTNTDVNSFPARKIDMLLETVNLTWGKFKILNTSIVNDELMQKLKSVYVENMSQDDFVEEVAKTIPTLASRYKIIKALNERGIDKFDTFKEFATFTNHRVLNIEYLDDVMDVGTLTVDIDEKYHDYHTYALSAGVFVKNSIDDLRYFNNKMLRALGVPSSYLPTGPEDGTSAVSDGRVGAAFIQEFRFAKVVTRYQQQIVEPLDLEFKLFLKHRGVTIDSSLFSINFTPAQSFSEYRQLELDSAKINTFTALTDISFVSKRFILKRYLGWTEAELAENERMWKEERSRLSKPSQPALGGGSAGGGGMSGGGGGMPGGSSSGLSDVGITSSGIDGMESGEDDMPDSDTDTAPEPDSSD